MTTPHRPAPDALTLARARDEALELVVEAHALIPESLRAAADQQPPRPGEVARTLVPSDVFDDNAQAAHQHYQYPGGGSVKVLPGTDVHRLATEMIDALQRREGWSAQQRSQPSEKLTDQRILTAPGGYAVSILPVRTDSPEPLVRVSVLSPGFLPPDDFSPHRKY